MPSRETIVQAVAVGLAFAVGTFLADRGELWTAVGFALFSALVFGGAHLYFALRGEGGMVPVASRWRFLTLVGIWAAILPLLFLAGDESIGGVAVGAVVPWIALLASLAYLVVEGRAAYRDSLSGD